MLQGLCAHSLCAHEGALSVIAMLKPISDLFLDHILVAPLAPGLVEQPNLVVHEGLHPGLSSKHQLFLAFYPKFESLLDEDIV